jgi:cell division septation protein DedD
MLEVDVHKFWVGVMIRFALAIILMALGVFSLPVRSANAQSAPLKVAQAQYPDAPPPRGRRPVTRLRVTPNYDGVYPHYDPGPNAVRACNAAYVQEFRPSGTVIVPHMHCFWRPG